jgi:hypothetical protein
MDEVTILTQTLNNTLQRHARATQAHEVEIANMTAEIIRLQARIDSLVEAANPESSAN